MEAYRDYAGLMCMCIYIYIFIYIKIWGSFKDEGGNAYGMKERNRNWHYYFIGAQHGEYFMDPCLHSCLTKRKFRVQGS